MILFLLAPVAFVGSQVCQSCHRNVDARYQQTAMARTTRSLQELFLSARSSM
ncbi:MAG: hypothetical protein IT167_19110 [Bryobacterales bacterium]|nr:hypothetical protein [Bryobacterales bacterium]